MPAQPKVKARRQCACDAYLFGIVKEAANPKQDQDQPKMGIAHNFHQYSLKILDLSREVF